MKGWRASLSHDLRAAVSVSMIGIPLGLGIALAMGAPLYAAIIPVVIGGVLVSWFSGSFVTVHSTPKMLIPVIAAAVISLGGSNLLAGYQLVLVALIIAGLTQVILGITRSGAVGEMIPNSVIKSLLAAVGVIIILKQYHVMLGSETKAKSSVDLIMALAENTMNLNPAIAFIGVISLCYLIIHPKINLPAVQAIPAPIWVILISLTYSLILGLKDLGTYHLFEADHVVLDKHMLMVPNSIKGSIVVPDWSGWTDPEVWSLSMTVAVIVVIEGILATKAIDRIDPQNRRTNVNQELISSGGGTMVSALIGGLPVIPGIVGSTVNVSHNGRTQMANLFQALFIVVILLALGSILSFIPLASLAAILVHTGLKLASPEIFIGTYRIGIGEFAILLVTLVVTVVWGLIIGIGAGIALGVMLLLWQLRSPIKLFRYLFKPNTVLAIEPDGKYLLSIEGYASFLNYRRLKKQIDAIPRNSSVIIDLGLTEVVDHSVMEHLHHFEQNFIRKGGSFEIIGLEGHDPSAPHQFANRRLLRISRMVGTKDILTSRQRKLKKLAKELAWNFKSNIRSFVPELEAFRMFRTSRIDRAFNKLEGMEGSVSITIQDVAYHQGEFHARERHQATLLTLGLQTKIPVFTMDLEHVFDRIASLAGYDDIDFEKFPEFSDTYNLKGPNESGIRELFNPTMIAFLTGIGAEHIESTGDQVLVLMKQRICTEQEILKLASVGSDLALMLHTPDRNSEV